MAFCYPHMPGSAFTREPEKFLPTTDENKYMDILQKVRDLGTCYPKTNVSIKFLFSENPTEE